MSRTDKTQPLAIRLAQGESIRFASWAERGSGPKGVRFAKREASKARRRGITHPWTVKSLTQTYKYNVG